MIVDDSAAEPQSIVNEIYEDVARKARSLADSVMERERDAEIADTALAAVQETSRVIQGLANALRTRHTAAAARDVIAAFADVAAAAQREAEDVVRDAHEYVRTADHRVALATVRLNARTDRYEYLARLLRQIDEHMP